MKTAVAYKEMNFFNLRVPRHTFPFHLQRKHCKYLIISMSYTRVFFTVIVSVGLNQLALPCVGLGKENDSLHAPFVFYYFLLACSSVTS